MPTPLFCLSGPTRAPFSPVHQMSAGQQIRGSGWQWRVGTGGQSSNLMLGWAVVAEGVQDGRKCRSQLVCMAASAKTWLLFVRVVVSVPLLILVQASLGWCTPMLGCLHRLVCLYKAQINSNQVCATNGCIRSQKLILRHVTRATTTHQLQKNAHKQTS